MTIYQSYPADHPAVQKSGLSQYRAGIWWVEYVDGAAARAIGRNEEGVRHVLLDLRYVRIDHRYLFPFCDEAEVREQFGAVWSELSRRYKNEGD